MFLMVVDDVEREGGKTRVAHGVRCRTLRPHLSFTINGKQGEDGHVMSMATVRVGVGTFRLIWHMEGKKR